MPQAIATIFGVPDSVAEHAGSAVVAFGALSVRVNLTAAALAGMTLKLDAELLRGEWIATSVHLITPMTARPADAPQASPVVPRASTTPAQAPRPTAASDHLPSSGYSGLVRRRPASGTASASAPAPATSEAPSRPRFDPANDDFDEDIPF